MRCKQRKYPFARSVGSKVLFRSGKLVKLELFVYRESPKMPIADGQATAAVRAGPVNARV